MAKHDAFYARSQGRRQNAFAQRHLVIVIVAAILLSCGLMIMASASAPSATSLMKGWFLIPPAGNRLETSFTGPNRTETLRWQVNREPVGPVLIRSAAMANFSLVSLQIWSREKTIIAVIVEDSDGAKFHAPVPLEPNTWTPVALSPGSFQLNDDSRVKKSALEPAKLKASIAIADLGKVLGQRSQNLLKMRNAEIEYGATSGANDLNVPSDISGTTCSITTNGTIKHPITIRNGGKLIIKAGSTRMAADITIDGGSVEINGGNFVVDEKFQHQFKFLARNGGTLVFKGCAFLSPFPTSVELTGNSKLEVSQCKFPQSGFTCTPENSSIRLENSQKPGEFVIDSGSHIKVQGCSGVLLWLGLVAGKKIDLTLPNSTGKIDYFKLPSETGLDVAVSQSDHTLWGLLAKPGWDVTIRDTTIFATGLIFPLRTNSKISNLQNNSVLKDVTISLPDRKLTFINSNVRAWNFYPMIASELDIANCTFGEINAFGQSKVTVHDSTCDGTGGYIGAFDNSRIELAGCTLNCALITTKKAQAILNHCQVNGAITASDESRIILQQSQTKGSQQKIGQGTITIRQ